MDEQQFVKQVVISRRGGPRVLKVEQVMPRDVRDHEVRVRVSTAGVAYADILMREGLYPDAPSTPFVPGYDVVGTVDAVGSQVTNLRPGQRVAVLCKVGGYSESLITDSWLAIPVPEAVGDAEGVALVLNYMTAYQMLRRMARVEPGERILVHGAAGGVGTALLQLAVGMKLDVWGTASAGKHPVLIEHGATPIDYRSQDFVEVVRNDTGDGVDAVFDAVGGKNWQRSLQTLRAGGRLVGYGFSAAMKNGRRHLGRAATAWLAAPRPSALTLMPKNIGIMGYNADRIAHARKDWYREDMCAVLDLCAKGVIKPLIEKELPLCDARRAHELLGTAQCTGKIVLRANATRALEWS